MGASFAGTKPGILNPLAISVLFSGIIESHRNPRTDTASLMSDPAHPLEVYLVGGAVRDEIMGRRIQDRDWLVVGSTPQEMIGLGFRPLGSNFPVFLHPITREEYALARTERKISRGYHGFEFNSDPGITLEQDLSRRDLTMNAMAKDREGNVIDPWGGCKDIRKGVIRHVSDAFREDPVRVLRVARFAARYRDDGFEVDPGTLELMSKMVEEGEVDALVAERVWQELERSLAEPGCSHFLGILRRCGALEKILPEVDALFGIPQTEKFHPEIDTGIHVQMSLDAATRISDDSMVRFAVMVHDLGKALTPAQELPRHRGHERRGIRPIRQLCDRIGVPARYREFALKVCQYHLHCHRMVQLKPATVLKVLEAFDGFRKPELIEKFSLACLADKRGRTGHENDSDEPMQLLNRYHRAAMAVDAGKIAAACHASVGSRSHCGPGIRKKIRRERIAAIRAIRDHRTKTGQPG